MLRTGLDNVPEPLSNIGARGWANNPTVDVEALSTLWRPDSGTR